MRTFPWLTGLVCAVAVTVATPAPVAAGTIGFRIDAEVTAGEEVRVKVTATHTGDENATEVYPEVSLLDRKAEGEKLPTLAAGAKHVWELNIPGPPLPKGAYVVAIRLRYADLNGYPFEALSTVQALVSAKAGSKVSGAFRIPKMSPDDKVVGTLALRRPPARKSSTFEGSILAPSGLEVSPERFPVMFDEAGNASVQLTINNKKLLPGTSVNIFALITGNDDGLRQTDTIRGTVSVGAAVARVSKVTFYGAAAALAGLWVLLEIAALLYDRTKGSR
ncbi:MAG TPA: hypothetical protein VEC57_19440 [Candidatus Limnocylindrales bacterium]|nr:hypothetical protein [Candidatus Limnocylindrales bacterium]